MTAKSSVTYTIEIVNGVVQRRVAPYIQEFETYAKGRWLGRKLLEVLSKEFGAHPPAYWQHGIQSGFVKVNGCKVDENYVLKNGDKFLHRTHRHEPPVFGSIEFVGETDTLMAVCKPSSVPMHPCGAYRFNSLENILLHEPIIPNQPQLHVVHRLDRLTSGLVVLAKNKEAASTISEEIRQKTTQKIYLARVKGKFPNHERSEIIPKLSDVHRIMENVEIQNEDCRAAQSEHRNRKRKHIESAGELLKGDAVSHIAFEDLVQHPNIGMIADTFSMAVDDSEADELIKFDRIWVSCPIGVVSHRDGIHACHHDGKLSISQFIHIGHDETTDTTLLLCIPFTGRTHQLRLHLEFLGNPIANDPCYGGKLFYGDTDRYTTAVENAAKLEEIGYIACSRIPHLSTSLGDGREKMDVPSNEIPLPRRENETDDEYLIRSCRFCKGGTSMASLEQSMHCDGIWLHALQYSGNGWSFRAPYPDWIQPFASHCIEKLLSFLQTEDFHQR